MVSLLLVENPARPYIALSPPRRGTELKSSHPDFTFATKAAILEAVTAIRGAVESLRAFGAVFANRSLRRLQLAGIGSTIGTWAYGVGLAVYAYESGGAKTVGLVYFARWGAAALAAPWLGLVVDRVSRRRVMVLADVVRACLLGGMAACAAAETGIWPVFALAVLASITSMVFSPAEGALLPSLVSTPEELTAANAVMNTVGSVGMFAGPALGGLLLAASGPSLVFAVTAATFVWSALCLVRIPRDAPMAAGEPEAMAAALLGGFRAIAAQPALRVVVGLTSAQTLVAGAFEVLLVVYALRILTAGSSGVGWLNAAVGIGGVLGVVAVAALAGRKRLAGDLGLGVVLWGLPLALAAVWTNLAFALVLFGVIGLANTVVDVAGLTLLQRSADDEVLGRVFAVLESLVMATLAIGALTAPALVSLIGVKSTLVAVGVFLPVLLVPLWPLLRRVDAAGRIATEPLELLRAIPMFALLPPPGLERLASAAREVRVYPTAVAVTQGEPGDAFYVIASGTAVVEIDGDEVARLGPGDFFGEIALLREVPRTATVRAVDELRLYALGRDAFIPAVTGHAPSREAADSVVAARLPAGVTP
jgi:MFS family permease